MINSDAFAERLQKVLDYYGLSASAFADEIDFNRSSISHLLSGRNKPSLDFVVKVLDKFPEVKLYWLLNGKGTFPDNTEDTEKTIQENTAQKTPQPTPLPDDIPLKEDTLPQKETDNTIERIVFFYKDGTYKVFENK